MRFYLAERDNGKHDVIVDGLDISRSVSAVTIESKAGERSRVTLALPGTRPDVDVDADVRVDAQTRELLIRLGWQPPAGE